MEKLYIISNESIFEKNGNFFCDNIDLKSTPEGLSKIFKVSLYGRSSKKKRAHIINLDSVKVSNSFASYFLNILRSLKDNSKYLIISITPYTFLITIFLKLFNKKVFVYLRSDGYGEYKAILGFFGPFIYHLMFTVISNISLLISCRKYILRGKPGEIVLPSQLSVNWFVNTSVPSLDAIKLLYVGRVKKEKGIFSLIKIINEIKNELSLTIVGAENNFNKFFLEKNIKLFNIEKDEKKLIEHYDNHNMFILPSFTEGHPMVLLESLSRLRPVIIFRDIEHVIKGRKGIFIAERNSKSLLEKINFIKQNYLFIQEEMKKNVLPTKDTFLKELSSIILKNN